MISSIDSPPLALCQPAEFARTTFAVWTGHSDIRTTRRYYLKVEPELMRAACRAVEAALETDAETEDGSE